MTTLPRPDPLAMPTPRGSSLRLTAALIVAGAAITGCSSGTAKPDAKVLLTSINTVKIQNFAFSPKTIAVKAGTVVTWTNLDAARHTVQADDTSFDSKAFGKGQSYSYTFGAAGIYHYSCGVHGSMTGTVDVS